MKKVILTKGLPGSGKSFWAKAYVEKHPGAVKRICKDDLRAMLDAGKWSKDNEKFVIDIRNLLIMKALGEGKHVIVDDTNLHPKHEANISVLVKGIAEVEIKDFTDVPLETCIERDLARSASVGEKVIRDMYNQFLQPVIQTYERDLKKVPAIIVDVDGTLALHSGRSPYEFEKLDTDLPNERIVQLVTRHFPDHQIIVVTGRSGEWAAATQGWLRKNGIKWNRFFCRAEGDDRKDDIVKREIFERDIHPTYYVDFVIDDRDRVVKMWRSLGLTCLQVAEGNF